MANSFMNEKEKIDIFNPIRQHRLSEEIYSQVKEAILSGNYKPGERLPSETALCETFGVGKPVVREALRFLENSGLIYVRAGAGGGSFVKKIDASVLTDTFEGIVRLDKLTLEEVMDSRMAIEMAVLPLVFQRIQSDDLKKLENNIKEARENLEKGGKELKNLHFHIILATISRNQLLIKIIEALFAFLAKMLERYEDSYERRKVVLDGHEQIVALLKAKKYNEVKELLERHIKDSISFFTALSRQNERGD